MGLGKGIAVGRLEVARCGEWVFQVGVVAAKGVGACCGDCWDGAAGVVGGIDGWGCELLSGPQ